MGIRERPLFKNENGIYCFRDWRKDDYTKISPQINYCSINHMNLPDKPGIYFFYIDNDLVYIGRSKNIRKRVGMHRSVVLNNQV